jgi:hypothetical protein
MFPWIEVAGLARAAGSPTAGMPIAARGYGVSGPGGMTATVPNLGTDWRIDPSQLQSGATGFDPIREDAGAEEYRRQQQSAIESLIDFTNWMKGELPPLDPVGQPSFPDYEKYRRTDAALDPEHRQNLRRGMCAGCESLGPSLFGECMQDSIAAAGGSSAVEPEQFESFMGSCHGASVRGVQQCQNRYCD